MLKEDYVRYVRLTVLGYAVAPLICDEQLLLVLESDVALVKVVEDYVPEVVCEVVLWMYSVCTPVERSLVDVPLDLHL
jgi:hypothetical protein